MFTNKIAYWAQVKGFRHNFLAKECEVSIQTFSRWATNKTQPDLKQAANLARILGISLDELIEEEDN
jgi:putative transcriptional regulator